MIIVVEEKETGGYDSQGNKMFIMYLECDTAADLPPLDYFVAEGRTKIAMGSKAHTISENAWYKVDSSGNWILQEPGQASYTRAEIDAMIAQIDILRQGTEIEANDDLNDYTEIGAYYSPNSARTATLYNRPWSGSGFKFLVLSISSTSKMQWLLPISNNANSIFFRSRTTSGFRPWYQLQGVEVSIINPYPPT